MKPDDVAASVQKWPRSYAKTLALHAVRTHKEGDADLHTLVERRQVVGVMGYKRDGGYLVVNQLASNRKGVGTQLMRFAARIAHKEGRMIRLAPSPSAQGFYDRLGFERLDRPEAPEEELVLRGPALQRVAWGKI